MSWSKSLATFAWIFPVGRGNAAFLRTALNHGFILDMGGGDLMSPAKFIEERFVPHLDEYVGKDSKSGKIAQAVLSHPHSDHIAECEALKKDSMHPNLLTCPNDKAEGEEVNWGRIKNIDGDEGVLQTYRDVQGGRRAPLQTICFESTRVPNLEYGVYYVRPPTCEKLHPANDNEYGNATSLMLFLRHGDHTILFPGDMTPAGMKHVLDENEGTEKRYSVLAAGASAANPDWHLRTCDQPSLRRVLGEHGLTVLVAPHHGLESCYSPELYEAIRGGRPHLVVLSERRKPRDGDGRTDARYQSEQGARSLRVDVDGRQETRYSLSTKAGHHILIVFWGTAYPRVVADKDPEVLYKILNEL